MNRIDLQKLSRLRIREATALLRLKHYEGAYYLSGCAVENALKACVAKQTRRHEFPRDQPVLNAWGHSLEGLAKVAGLWAALKREIRDNETFAVNWALTKDWSPGQKYELTIESALARDFHSAVTARKYGVLPWIRDRW